MTRKLYASRTIAQSAIDQAFRLAKMFKWTHETLDARVAKIREELCSKTPAGRWRYVEFERFAAEGYIAARYNDVWQHVEFCYRDADGVLYSTHDNSSYRKTEEFYASGRSSELSKLQCAHVWKGTDKNYTSWHAYPDVDPATLARAVYRVCNATYEQFSSVRANTRSAAQPTEQ